MDNDIKKMCIIGLGYIGLLTAFVLPHKKEVFVVDEKSDIVDKINNKEMTFEEPLLRDMLDIAGMTVDTDLVKGMQL
jgi:UDP-glucose 6-dehydrogenase